MPRADLLVVGASEVATLRGPARPRRRKELAELSLVKDGAIAVRDGRIVAVGRRRDVKGRFGTAETLDVEGRAVVPGFVDAHTHLPFAGSRAFELDLKLSGKSYLDILREGGGIHRTVRDTRAAPLRELVALVTKRLDVMLAWGTTTVEAKSGYGLTPEDEIKQLRALQLAKKAQPVDIVPTFLGAHVVPQEYEGKREEYVRLITRKMIPEISRRQLAEFCDAFLESSAFTASECTDILTEARRFRFQLKLHADEFTNKRGAQLAARLGCASAEHLLRVSHGGIRALAKSSTVAVLLPGVTITSFLDRFAPARRMIDGGAAVALGTDFNPNCHVLTMPTVLQWACYHMAMRPAEVLAAATVNAAWAVGRGEQVGTIEVGKQADFAVVEGESISDLFYGLGSNPIRWTVKRGQVYAGTTGASKPRSQR